MVGNSVFSEVCSDRLGNIVFRIAFGMMAKRECGCGNLRAWMLWRCRLRFLLLGFFRGRKASHAMSHFSEPNSFTKPLFDQLKRHPKRIVFPEGEDERVLRVAARFVELGLGVPYFAW
jgi:hypothetical protein